MKLSVIIPVFNAALSIQILIEKLFDVLNSLDFEIILINDGSRDNSEEICEKSAKTYNNIKFISLRRNFGEHNAVMCGLHFVSGDFAVIIDDDLQNPPEEILKLLSEIENGYDVVYSKYYKKRHSAMRNFGSKFNNLIANFMMPKPKRLYLSSFKIIKKELVEEIIKYQGPFPYIDGLIIRTTNNISSVYVEHNESINEKSNYTLKKLVSLYMNMFLNFSVKPLRVFTILGVTIFVIGVLLSIWFVIAKILYNDSIGWTSIIVAVLTFSGFQIIFLGLIAEYLGKQHLDINKTPQFVIKKQILNKTVSLKFDK